MARASNLIVLGKTIDMLRSTIAQCLEHVQLLFELGKDLIAARMTAVSLSTESSFSKSVSVAEQVVRPSETLALAA